VRQLCRTAGRLVTHGPSSTFNKVSCPPTAVAAGELKWCYHLNNGTIAIFGGMAAGFPSDLLSSRLSFDAAN
jgi:hypothetical protein